MAGGEEVADRGATSKADRGATSRGDRGAISRGDGGGEGEKEDDKRQDEKERLGGRL